MAGRTANAEAGGRFATPSTSSWPRRPGRRTAMPDIGAVEYLTTLQDTVSSLQATLQNLPPSDGVEDGVPPDGVVPADIVRFLARLRLLEGVPFGYLVADAELLPPE